MSNRAIKPYIILPAHHHLIGVDFHHGESEKPLSNRQFLEGFSPASEVTITARIKIENKHKLSEALHVEGDDLGLSLSLNCPATRFRITSEYVLGDSKIQSLKLIVQPGSISQQSTLTAKLLLYKAPSRRVKLGAHKVGSVLWEDSIRVQLEGTGSTFPTQEHEFSSDEGGENAGWRFDFSGANLRGRASRLRLLINQRNKKFLKGVLDSPEKGGNPEAARMFRYSVACALIDFCAANHEEFEQADYSFTDKGSLGYHLVNFLQAHIRNGNVPRPIVTYLKVYHNDFEYREKIRAVLQSNIQDDTVD
jgi:hypothetical protein